MSFDYVSEERQRDRERERERKRERGYESLQRSGWNCDGRSEDGVLALSQRGRGLWLQTVGLSALESTARSSLDTNALCAVFWMGRCCFSIFCCNLLQVLPTAYTERGCACHIFFREMPCLAEDPCAPPLHSPLVQASYISLRRAPKSSSTAFRNKLPLRFPKRSAKVLDTGIAILVKRETFDVVALLLLGTMLFYCNRT